MNLPLFSSLLRAFCCVLFSFFSLRRSKRRGRGKRPGIYSAEAERSRMLRGCWGKFQSMEGFQHLLAT
jgi:hypothetical protein